jgi:WD40 repeat protein
MILANGIKRITNFLLAGFTLGLIETQLLGLIHYRTFPTSLQDLISTISSTEGVIRTDHIQGIISLAISDDSKWIASGSADGKIQLWDLKTQKLVHSFLGHKTGVYSMSLVFHPSRQTLISGGDDGTIRIWDLQTGKEIRTLKVPFKSVRALAISPDGKSIIASGGLDGIILKFNSTTQVEVCKLVSDPPFTSEAISINPDGATLISTNTFGEIKNWNLATCKLNPGFDGQGESSGVISLDYYSFASFSPDGKKLATNSNQNIRISNPQTGSKLKNLSAHRDYINAALFSPDGRKLVSGGRDNTIKIWDLESGSVLKTLLGNHGIIYSIAISPDGKTIASSGKDRMIRLWKLVD